MRRATITLPDDLEADLDAYLATRDAPPSLTALVQAALRRYLAERSYPEEARPPGGPTDRPYPIAGGGGPAEVAEGMVPYGTTAPPGASGWTAHSGGPPPWLSPWGRHLGDLPELLSSLPRLSEAEADSFAADLAVAREELGRADRAERAERPDPWSS